MNIDEVVELFEWLRVQKHTGAVTFHLSQGKPANAVEFPRAPQRIVLDGGRPKPVDLTLSVDSRG